MVSDSRALVDFAPTGRGACDVEKRTNQLRLPCVAVSNDRKVANCFGGVDFHKSETVLSEIEFPLTHGDRHPCVSFANERAECDCGLSDNLAEREGEWQAGWSDSI